MKSILRFCIRLLGTLTLLSVLLGGAGVYFAGWWLPQDDVPGVAEAIVVLGGSYSRPIYGADLFRRGFADTVYIPRVQRTDTERLVREAGFVVPRHEEVYHRILTRGRVPSAAIRFFGVDLHSTIAEAEAIAKKLGKDSGRLIVVTSPYHVQRARMIFRDVLPHWNIMVCATPYEVFPEKWWQSQDAARHVVLESAKIIFYLCGGAFR